jgi:hypothetical protein
MRSGTPIRGEFPTRSGKQTTQERPLQIRLDRQLPPTPHRRPNTKKKRPQGKKHNAAVICLASRRCAVSYPMLRHGIFYEEKPVLAA